MNKPTTLLLTLLLVCASWMPAMAADTPAVLGIVEIRGLDSLSASAADLVGVVGEPMPKEMISMMMYGALGTMPGMGLQREGSIRAVMFQGDGPEPAVALLLPVENEGADYLAGLAASGWANETETAEGIQHFIAPDESMVAWKEAYFLARGSSLIAGQTADAVRMAAAALPSLPPILPVEGDVAIQIRPAVAVKAYAAEIQGLMDEALKPTPQTPPETAAMLSLYMRGYLAVAKQVDEVVLGLGVADGNLNIHQRVAPVADTTLARWLGSIRPPSAAASVVNLPDALYAETAHMGDLSILAPAYFRWAEEMMELMPEPLDEETLAVYMENTKAYWEQIAGDFGISLLPPTTEYPLRLVEYVALKDSSALRELTRQMVESANEMMQAGMAADQPTPLGIELTLGEAREYREIPVEKLSYGLIPGAQLESMWPEKLPKQLEAEMAWVPGGLLVSIGDSAQLEDLVDRVLDGTATPITSRPAWKAAYPMPEADLLDVTHISIFDTIRSYIKLVDVYTGEDSGAAEMIPAGPGNVESTSYMAIGGMMTRIRISLADIAAIGEKVQEVQQAQEAAQAAFMEEMMMEMDAMEDEDSQTMDEDEVEEWTADDEEMDAMPAPMAPAPVPAQ